VVTQDQSQPKDALLEDTTDIPTPDPNLLLNASTVERSELSHAALIIDVVAKDGITPVSHFDLLLADFEENVVVLRDRSNQVGLADISKVQYLCARSADGWSNIASARDREDIDGTPHLQIVLEQPQVGFHLTTSSAEGVSTAAAELQLSATNDVAQIFLSSNLESPNLHAAADGSFSLEGLPPAEYNMSLTLEGHGPAVLQADLKEGSRTDLEVEFLAAGAAQGRVVAHDQGLAGATVALLPADFQDNIFSFALDRFRSVGQVPRNIPAFHQSTTDDQGHYQFETATPGDYILLVAAADYLPLVSAEKFTIVAHEMTTCNDVTLELGFGINLIVVDSKAIPLPEVSVTWYRNAGSSLVEARRRRSVEAQQTNKRGRLHLGGLPAELLTLEISHPDYALVVLKHDFSGRTEATTETLEVVLHVGATVAGSVVDGRTGMPIADVELELHTTENNQAFGALLRGSDWNAESGQDGKFDFSNLPSGEYVLIAKHEDFAETTKGPIQVRESAVEDITLMMHPGATLLVTVLDSEGVPIANATVQAVNTVAQQIKTETTNEEGLARLENVTPGGYQVAFTDVSSFDTASNSGSLDVSFKFIEIEEGEELEVTLGGPMMSATVEGAVRLGGELVTSATVAILTDSGMKIDTTDELGGFKVEGVPMGSFIIIARSGLPTAGGSVFYDSIDVNQEGTIRHDISMPNDGVKVVVVSASDRKPLPSIPVTVRPMDGSNISGGDFGVTDADGVAEFPSLSEGVYIIGAGNATASFMASTETGHGAKQQSHVNIHAGSGVQTIELALELGATFKVQVEDPDGNLLAGAHMHYLDSEGQPLNILSMKGTNAKGVAQMTGLPSGPGIILVRHPLLGSKEIQVNLRAGEEAKRKVRLDAGTVIYVTTTDSEGQPVSGVLAAALDQRGAPLSYLWSQEETQATNAAFFGLGEQKLGPLPDGDYIIQLYRPGKPPVKHEVSINGQGEMHLRLPYSSE
jgi:5-hydroxyisourate hydrolase-like protein (transthyretin family)